MLRNKLVLATHNLHKKTEMNSILSSLGILIVGLDQFPQIGDIEETGSTLLENAFIKARTVYKVTGLPSLADDTGLEAGSYLGLSGADVKTVTGALTLLSSLFFITPSCELRPNQSPHIRLNIPDFFSVISAVTE